MPKGCKEQCKIFNRNKYLHSLTLITYITRFVNPFGKEGITMKNFKEIPHKHIFKTEM